MNEAKDNLDALSIQIKKLPREQQINYINVGFEFVLKMTL
jgi:hypothetical protein